MVDIMLKEPLKGDGSENIEHKTKIFLNANSKITRHPSRFNICKEERTGAPERERLFRALQPFI